MRRKITNGENTKNEKPTTVAPSSRMNTTNIQALSRRHAVNPKMSVSRVSAQKARTSGVCSETFLSVAPSPNDIFTKIEECKRKSGAHENERNQIEMRESARMHYQIAAARNRKSPCRP